MVEFIKGILKWIILTLIIILIIFGVYRLTTNDNSKKEEKLTSKIENVKEEETKESEEIETPPVEEMETTEEEQISNEVVETPDTASNSGISIVIGLFTLTTGLYFVHKNANN